MNASEKIAKVGKLLTQSKALIAAAAEQQAAARKALDEAKALDAEAKVLLAEIAADIKLEA